MSNRSGGTDGRPVSAYIRSKRRDIESSARSAIARIERIGWSAGTADSGETRHSIDDGLGL